MCFVQVSNLALNHTKRITVCTGQTLACGRAHARYSDCSVGARLCCHHMMKSHVCSFFLIRAFFRHNLMWHFYATQRRNKKRNKKVPAGKNLTHKTCLGSIVKCCETSLLVMVPFNMPQTKLLTRQLHRTDQLFSLDNVFNLSFYEYNYIVRHSESSCFAVPKSYHFMFCVIVPSLCFFYIMSSLKETANFCDSHRQIKNKAQVVSSQVQFSSTFRYSLRSYFTFNAPILWFR